MQNITKETLARLAALAELSLDEGEVAPLSDALAEMIAMLADLGGVQGEGQREDAQTTASLRADVQGVSLPRDAALANAPERAGEYIAVPRVVE